jgi:hypothetical protein
MDSFVRDLRHAVRNLLRTPGFAVITVFTLALGIGANTAIFSVVNAVILRPLGYPRPERLVYISSQFPQMGFDQFWISPPEFLEFQERTKSFSSVGLSPRVRPTSPRRIVHAVSFPGLRPRTSSRSSASTRGTGGRSTTPRRVPTARRWRCCRTRCGSRHSAAARTS